MDNTKTDLFKHNKRLAGIVLVIPILLLMPLVAMLFTDEVRWTLVDFIAAGILPFSTGRPLRHTTGRALSKQVVR